MITTLKLLQTVFIPLWILLVTSQCSKADRFTAADKEAVDVLVKQWAPLVWLAPGERFMPSDVNEFLRHVHVHEQENSNIKKYFAKFLKGTRYQVEENPSKKDFQILDRNFIYNDFINNPSFQEISEKSYLVTNNEIDELLYNSTSFLYGKNPTKYPVPIYAVVKVCDTPQDVPDYMTQSPGVIQYPFIPVTIPEETNFNKIETEPGNKFAYPPSPRKRRETPLEPSVTKETDDQNEIQMDTNKKPVFNEFMANVADNVKFTTNDIENTVNPTQHGIPNFHVTYWMFYPYSQGKTMCTLNLGPFGRMPIPLIFGNCIGSRKDFGSHVGDWEHMSLFFTGSSEPSAMYVSAHDAGAYYSYNRLTGTFEFRSQETRKGILQRPNFPKTVTTSFKHPVLFAALGSHGLWTAPGKHRFVRVPRLYDVNGFGTPWYTWKDVDITYENLRSQRSLAPNWFHFKGKWGNPKSKCHPLRRIGLNLCEYTDGPTGIPLKPAHFHCSI